MDSNCVVMGCLWESFSHKYLLGIYFISFYSLSNFPCPFFCCYSLFILLPIFSFFHFSFILWLFQISFCVIQFLAFLICFVLFFLLLFFFLVCFFSLYVHRHYKMLLLLDIFRMGTIRILIENNKTSCFCLQEVVVFLLFFGSFKD